MSKSKVKKVVKRRLAFFGTISIVCIVYFAFTFSYHVYTLINLKKQKAQLENTYIILQEDAEELSDEIEKFSDKEYLAKYARENYLYSTDNEYIIRIKDDMKDDIKQGDVNIKNQYIVIIFSGVLILIFIYIIKRGFSKKDKNKKH